VTTTVTIGKRGTIVIPKAMRDQCRMDEGRQVDVSMENNTIVIAPSLQTRTRLDENFDEMRSILAAKGVTLEMAMETLRDIKQTHG
jgi:AbrB family looped-hinge helix DNA binding protein